MSFLDQYHDALAPEAPPKQAPRDLFDYSEGSYTGQAVADSPDLQRVLALPRRPRPGSFEMKRIQDYWTAKLGYDNPNCQCASFRPHLVAAGMDPCAKYLTPDQAWTLDEASRTHGVAAAIGVGSGKTLLDLLIAMVVPNTKCAVLLIPPDLRVQLKYDWDYYSQHWNLPNKAGSSFIVPGRPWLHIYAYSELSGPKSSALLENIKPDLVIGDEGHNLRHFATSRTRRMRDFMRKYPHTRSAYWSGTLTKDSLKDFAHLFAYALKHGAPVPLKYTVVEEWASAIDPPTNPLIPSAPPGALALLTPGAPMQTQRQLWEAFQKRLEETPGVILSTSEQVCNASIIIDERKVKQIPPLVKQHLEEIRTDWKRPDGEELREAIDRARCLRQMACGFYYVWKWPKNAPDELIRRWLAARKAYNKAVRLRLAVPRMHLDSERLCREAAIRHLEGCKGPLPVWDCPEWPAWRDVASEFFRVTGKKKPDTVPIWVDDFIARDAADWARKNVGIVWVEHKAIGQKLAELTGCPLYAGGDEADEALTKETGKRTIIATVKSAGTGKNLQMFNRMLVMSPPGDGGGWTQLIGRCHRRGQPMDEVRVTVYRHTPEMCASLDRAYTKSDYIQSTMKGSQKLLHATCLFVRQ